MSPGVGPHIYCQIIFYKGAKAIRWRKNSVLTGTFVDPCAKRNLYPLLIHHTKVNSQWIIYRNVKFPGENLEENLSKLRLGKYFLNMMPKAQSIKEKNDK